MTRVMATVRRQLPGGRSRAVAAAFGHGYQTGGADADGVRLEMDDPIDPLDMMQFIAERVAAFAEELASDMRYIERRLVEARNPDLTH